MEDLNNLLIPGIVIFIYGWILIEFAWWFGI